MSICEKCWEEASRKMYIYTDKTQTELYLRIIAEHNNHTDKAQKDSTKLKQIAGILKRQLRATGMIHKINDVLNKD